MTTPNQPSLEKKPIIISIGESKSVFTRRVCTNAAGRQLIITIPTAVWSGRIASGDVVRVTVEKLDATQNTQKFYECKKCYGRSTAKECPLCNRSDSNALLTQLKEEK